MIAITGRVLEDGMWFFILAAVLAFFWFHQRGASRPNRSTEEKLNKRAEAGPSKFGKAA